MKEISNDTLLQAISKLQGYKPPGSCWDIVSTSLDGMAEYNTIDLWEAVDRLPAHAAPTGLWSSIEAALPRPKVLIFRPWVRMAAATFIGISLLSLSVYWAIKPPAALDGLSFSEEILEDESMVSFRNPEEEAALEMVRMKCLADQTICERVDYKALNKQLEELDKERSKVLDMLGKFSKDQSIISQLAKIERERADVIKALIKVS